MERDLSRAEVAHRQTAPTGAARGVALHTAIGPASGDETARCAVVVEYRDASGKADLSAISDMGVGYRDRYIVEAVHDINSGKIDLPSLSKKSDNDLFEVLTSMFGVGTKVANCTMLFGFGRTGRFPVDVWIKRILDKYYGGSFDTSPYPETAGIMQQFMFYYERNGASRS